jgi:glyoxylase-like metal-dependent hydrolase (beta-lactamase superfamily II)
VQVTRIADGLWRWTGWHEEWKQEVGCVYLETADGICLFDPLVPPEDTERFLAALDRDVERAGAEVHVLITVFWHARHARELLERYGGRLWAPSRARAAVARRAGEVTDPFRPGDPLPGGILALETGRGTEAAYYVPEHRALVPGDVLLGAEGGGLRFCPESWLPSGTGHARLREALRPVLDLDVERVLVSHGEPVLERGADALRPLFPDARP